MILPDECGHSLTIRNSIVAIKRRKKDVAITMVIKSDILAMVTRPSFGLYVQMRDHIGIFYYYILEPFQLNLHCSYKKTVYGVRINTLQSTHYIQPTYRMLLTERKDFNQQL